MTKDEAYFAIRTHIVQPRKQQLLSGGITVPQFTQGAARLYEVIIRRTRINKGSNWRTQNVEESKCSSSLKSLAYASGLCLERAQRYYYQLAKEGLMEILRGTGHKGKDECRATPEKLLTFPAVRKVAPKTHAERQKEYRARKKAEVEALKAQLVKKQETLYV